MTEFEQVLEQCLGDLEGGASSVDQCLARHPEHAAHLKPILSIAAGLAQGRTLEPSAAFKARARAKLTLHMQAHPRKTARSGFAFWRLAASLAMITLALLAAGTTYAQSALPGDLFYEWKLLSERAWRVISLDPIQADLMIANRRIDELNAVAQDPVRHALALEGYQEVLTRLQVELGTETLEQTLPKIDIAPQAIDTLEPLIPTPLLNPTDSPLPSVPLETTSTSGPADTPTPLPNLPGNVPTEPPQIIPTLPPATAPNILPTLDIPPPTVPDSLPTVQVPSLLP